MSQWVAGPGEHLDPRWEWIEVTTMHELGSRWIRGACRHLEVVEVNSVVPEVGVVARLCLTCDMMVESW